MLTRWYLTQWYPAAIANEGQKLPALRGGSVALSVNECEILRRFSEVDRS
jgi:hypothetical protein